MKKISENAIKTLGGYRKEKWELLTKKPHIPKALHATHAAGHIVVTKQIDTEGMQARDHYHVIHKNTGKVMKTYKSGSYGGNSGQDTAILTGAGIPGGHAGYGKEGYGKEGY